MGTLKNCSECGKLYTEVGQGMCRDCYEKEQEQEQVVYDYVRDHDKCGIKEIVDDKAKYADWSTREDIKATLQVDLIILLDEFDYPPVTIDDVYKEVLEQAENFKKYSK